jgi:2-polyprenyl-6-methoxyphenol hydroxylase-like FAD-dependent oxidoreductase
MNSKTVLISGASIGGPALAYWLRRNGFAPTVVEISPTLRPGGQTVDLRGAGRVVAERMGIMPAVRAACVDEHGIAYVDANDRWLASMPADLFDGEGIVAEIEIMRGDLSRVLYDAAQDGVEYLFGDSIAQLDESADGVTVRFASGVVRTFDLVVGADGVHSGVRRLAFGPEEDFVRPLGGYTAYFSVPDPFEENQWFLMYNEPGGKVAGLRPERDGIAKAMLSFTAPALDYDRRDVDAQRAILAEKFAGAGWRVPAMLDAMWTAPDFYFDTICQVHVEKWARGRVVLLGDAGYCGSPLSGMGTSMTLVGAYVLAGELAATPDDHAAAFARYQDVMRDYVKQCQELPPGGLNGFAPQGRLMLKARVLSMRMMNHWPMRGMLAKQFGKADAITLPRYETTAQRPAGLRPSAA